MVVLAFTAVFIIIIIVYDYYSCFTLLKHPPIQGMTTLGSTVKVGPLIVDSV